MIIQMVQPELWKKYYVVEGYEVGYNGETWIAITVGKDDLIIQSLQNEKELKVNKNKITWIKNRRFEEIPYAIRNKCLENMKKRFAKGTFITLLKMDDPFDKGMYPGLFGMSVDVDDAGTIHVRWENGSGLGIIYGEDAIAIIDKNFSFQRGDIIQFNNEGHKFVVMLNLGTYGLIKNLSTDLELYTSWVQKLGRYKLKAQKVDRLPDHMVFDL